MQQVWKDTIKPKFCNYFNSLTLLFPIETIFWIIITRSSPSEVFLGKNVLKIWSKFIGEHQCRSLISIKLQGIFIETTLQHGCSPVNLLPIFGTTFPNNTSGWLLLHYVDSKQWIKDSNKFARCSIVVWLSTQCVSHIGFTFDFNAFLQGFFNNIDNFTFLWHFGETFLKQSKHRRTGANFFRGQS